MRSLMGQMGKVDAGSENGIASSREVKARGEAGRNSGI